MGKKEKNTKKNSSKIVSDDDSENDAHFNGNKNQKIKKQKAGSNPKKKNGGKNSDPLQRALEADGSKSVIEMAADGNCLFRSLSDQLYFDYGSRHLEIRDDVVDYMEGHKDDFVVFLVLDDKDSNDEDASDFESYCNDMRNDGTWGGNLELVAASRMYRRNITVYSSDLAAFTIHHDSEKNSSGHDLLLSYHDNDHYNSVRINNMATKKIPLPIKTYNKYSSTEGTDSNNMIIAHEYRLDDEASTTDTDSSRQSSNNVSVMSDNTAATTETGATATSAATAATASTGGSQSTTSTVESGNTTLCSTTTSVSNTSSSSSLSRDNNNSKNNSPSDEKKKTKNNGMPRLKKLIRGYKNIVDDDKSHDDPDNNNNTTKKMLRKKNRKSTGSSDDESMSGHFRVLRI